MLNFNCWHDWNKLGNSQTFATWSQTIENSSLYKICHFIRLARGFFNRNFYENWFKITRGHWQSCRILHESLWTEFAASISNFYALMNPNLFTLIQGPPGTGKTRNWRILAVLFGRPSSYTSTISNYKESWFVPHRMRQLTKLWED